MLPYAKMKGELEDAVRDLGFRETVIVRPGLIVGKERSDRSFGQWWAGNVAGGLGRVSKGWKDGWAQDADVIARAAVRAGMMAMEGKAEGREGWWVLGQADVVRLGAESLAEK